MRPTGSGAAKQASRKTAKRGRSAGGRPKQAVPVAALQARLAEAELHRRAMSEILEIISASEGELQPVFQAILKNAISLCEAKFGNLLLIDGGHVRWAAGYRIPVRLARYLQSPSFKPTPGSHLDRVIRHRKVSHSADDRAEPVIGASARLGGARSTLCVPMVRGKTLVGAIFMYRTEVRPFTDSQIDLAKSFATQAVIAVQNARLLAEIQARSDDLAKSLQQQTATSEILRVISSSVGELAPVFTAMVESAGRICDAANATIFLRDGDHATIAAKFGAMSGRPIGYREPLDRRILLGKAILDAETVHVEDLTKSDEYPLGRERALRFGNRATLAVPLVREGVAIGGILLRRAEPVAFTPKQVELVENFANQAVIAIENARLLGALHQRTGELEVSLRQQTATADVLQAISRSTFDIEAILQTLIRTAAHLCNTGPASIFLRDGDVYRWAASQILEPAYLEHEKKSVLRPGRGTLVGRVALEKRAIHVVDVLDDPEYEEKDALRVAKLRTVLCVPMLRDGEPIGAFCLARDRVEPFTESEIRLVSTFADQAVIAIQNVGLFDQVQAKTRDLEESLQQQTATADVLKVISRSTFDLKIVLDTLLDSALELVDAQQGALFHREKNAFYPMAIRGYTPELLAFARANPLPVGAGYVGRVATTGEVVHVPDVLNDLSELTLRDYRQHLNIRSWLGIPIVRDGAVDGVFALVRDQPGPFSPRQIELVKTFADQAAVAVNNTRMFNETKEALEHQTATAEVLNVISGSMADPKPVFDRIVDSIERLFDCRQIAIFLAPGDGLLHLAARRGMNAEALDSVYPQPLEHSAAPIVLGTRSQIYYPDTLYGPDVPQTIRNAALAMGNFSDVLTPMMWKDRGIGMIAVTREAHAGFSEKELNLLRTFADQAVIAIENARLFNETREALERQTATAEVLKVIASSPSDLQPVLDAIVKISRQLCGSEASTIFLLHDNCFHVAAIEGPWPGFLDEIRAKPIPADQRGSSAARAVRERRTVYVPDTTKDPEYGQGGPISAGGARRLLSVPLMRSGEVVGVLTLRQPLAKPFTERQIEAIETFADQAVIAISNVNLFDQVQARTKELSQSLDDLRAAQDRLVATEKLASLGQLTAGIAHEIKNPLNFINNFSMLSAELIDEITETLARTNLTPERHNELNELTEMLKGNLEKVAQHGRRADSIVKNMLLHSREGSGEQRPADVNALVDEGLNLAYHGARAEKPGFNITLQRKLDPAAGQADVYPQEITRVLLNVISNGFHAATQRAADSNGAFEPSLSAETRNLGGRVEIRIRDNGIGMTADVKARIFTPFFTTKPPGEGTGLGLSMSHDIIVKQHGGTIEVETEPGSFTEFIITLPRQLTDTRKIGSER